MNNTTLLIGTLVVGVLFMAGCTAAINSNDNIVDDNTGSSTTGEFVVNSVSLQDDFTGAKVEKGDLLQGCFGGKDCIPSIDDPVFESAADGDIWLEDDDRVFAVNFEGVQRAYPQRILNWHEIVNDEIGDMRFIVTFCPLCGSSLAFEPTVDGRFTEFGVSGKLHESDLVMYDRYEGNLWQQISGDAIVGPAAQRDETLTLLPMTTTTWSEWKTEFPDTEVLSRETGFARDYGRYPYGTYEQDDEIYFGVENLDESLQIKTVIYGVELDDGSKAYPESAIKEMGVIEDEIAGVAVTVEYTDAGAVKVTNMITGEEIVPIRLFWFAWAAFHPDTELYRVND